MVCKQTCRWGMEKVSVERENVFFTKLDVETHYQSMLSLDISGVGHQAWTFGRRTRFEGEELSSAKLHSGWPIWKSIQHAWRRDSEVAVKRVEYEVMGIGSHYCRERCKFSGLLCLWRHYVKHWDEVHGKEWWVFSVHMAYFLVHSLALASYFALSVL